MDPHRNKYQYKIQHDRQRILWIDPALFLLEFRDYFQLTDPEFHFWIELAVSSKEKNYSKEYILKKFYGKTRFAEKAWSEFQIVEKLDLNLVQSRKSGSLQTFYIIGKECQEKLRKYLDNFYSTQS